MDRKKCNTCGEEKDLSDYGNCTNRLSKKVYKKNQCNRCRNILRRRANELNKPAYRLERFKGRLKTRFNMRIEDFNKLLDAQDSKCAICKEPIILLGDCKKSKKHAIDHDHRTGKIRGILCNVCNVGLGHFKDNIFLLERAIEYLGKYVVT